MNPHKGWLGAEFTHREGEMLATVDFVAEHVEVEVSKFRRKWFGANELDEFIAAMPILDQGGDGDHLQPEALLENDQIGNTRDRAVIVYDFAQDARRWKPGEDGEVDRSFSVTCPFQHTARAATKGENMPRLHELVGPSCRIGDQPDRCGAIDRTDPRRNTLGSVDGD